LLFGIFLPARVLVIYDFPFLLLVICDLVLKLSCIESFISVFWEFDILIKTIYKKVYFRHQNTKTPNCTKNIFFGGIWCFGDLVAKYSLYPFYPKLINHSTKLRRNIT